MVFREWIYGGLVSRGVRFLAELRGGFCAELRGVWFLGSINEDLFIFYNHLL
jgi:hypothetical protein